MLLIVTNLHKKCIPESQDGQNFWQRAICNLHSMLQLSTCVTEKKHSSVISKSDARNFLHVYY